MGLSTALYRRSFLSVDIVDLPSSQCICFAFCLMCFAYVSLLSRCMARYSTSFFWGRSTLPICTVGQVWLCRMNVICVDLLKDKFE
jgi:hypothetical protein